MTLFFLLESKEMGEKVGKAENGCFPEILWFRGEEMRILARLTLVASRGVTVMSIICTTRVNPPSVKSCGTALECR